MRRKFLKAPKTLREGFGRFRRLQKSYSNGSESSERLKNHFSTCRRVPKVSKNIFGGFGDSRRLQKSFSGISEDSERVERHILVGISCVTPLFLSTWAVGVAPFPAFAGRSAVSALSAKAFQDAWSPRWSCRRY